MSNGEEPRHRLRTFYLTYSETRQLQVSVQLRVPEKIQAADLHRYAREVIDWEELLRLDTTRGPNVLGIEHRELLDVALGEEAN